MILFSLIMSLIVIDPGIVFSHDQYTQMTNEDDGIVHAHGLSSECLIGNKTVRTDIRNVAPFSEIKVDGVFNVIVDLQKPLTLTITAEENILPFIQTEIQGETLHLNTQKSLCPTMPLEINISLKALTKILTDGANDIQIVNLQAEKFSAILDGSSLLQISGSTEYFMAEILGANELFAEDLLSKYAEITIEGSGEARVQASQKLVAAIHGAGDIFYSGNPPEVVTNITGAGAVERQ